MKKTAAILSLLALASAGRRSRDASSSSNAIRASRTARARQALPAHCLVSSKIVGGEEAGEREFPFQVGLH